MKCNGVWRRSVIYLYVCLVPVSSDSESLNYVCSLSTLLEVHNMEHRLGAVFIRLVVVLLLLLLFDTCCCCCCCCTSTSTVYAVTSFVSLKSNKKIIIYFLNSVVLHTPLYMRI